MGWARCHAHLENHVPAPGDAGGWAILLLGRPWFVTVTPAAAGGVPLVVPDPAGRSGLVALVV